jgi:hypothetical protein
MESVRKQKKRETELQFPGQNLGFESSMLTGRISGYTGVFAGQVIREKGQIFWETSRTE